MQADNIPQGGTGEEKKTSLNFFFSPGTGSDSWRVNWEGLEIVEICVKSQRSVPGRRDVGIRTLLWSTDSGTVSHCV